MCLHRLHGHGGDGEGQGRKPGVLQPMGSQRAGHSWATEQQILVQAVYASHCFTHLQCGCLRVPTLHVSFLCPKFHPGALPCFWTTKSRGSHLYNGHTKPNQSLPPSSPSSFLFWGERKSCFPLLSEWRVGNFNSLKEEVSGESKVMSN